MTSSHLLNFMYFLLKQDVGEDMLMGEENGFISLVLSAEGIYCVSSRVSSLFIRLRGRLKEHYVVLEKKFTLRI